MNGSLSDQLVDFGRLLRRAGVMIDSERIGLAIQSASWVGVSNIRDFQSALSSVFVSQQQDLDVFNQLFDLFFLQSRDEDHLLSPLNASSTEKNKKSQHRLRLQQLLNSSPSISSKINQEAVFQHNALLTASELTRLQQADFKNLSHAEFLQVMRLAQRIDLPLPQVLGRRTASGSRGHHLDWPKALRQTARHGGELFQLPHRVRRQQYLPMLILIDVSGSMERYARLMLTFLHQATQKIPRSVFAFGTELTDLQSAFQCRDVDKMLDGINQSVQDYAGGTRLGASLTTLRTQYSRRMVGRRTVVMLITDGLDTGPTSVLDLELAWLERHSKQMVWLNPLLRFDGYAPITASAKILHRYADAMLAIHNMDRLSDLAHAVSQLLKTGQSPHSKIGV